MGSPVNRLAAAAAVTFTLAASVTAMLPAPLPAQALPGDSTVRAIIS